MTAADHAEALAPLRASIDNLDAALVHILAERFRVTREVGELKAAHALPAQDPARETAQRGRVRALAAEAGLDPDIAERIHGLVLEEVRTGHRAIAARGAT